MITRNLLIYSGVYIVIFVTFYSIIPYIFLCNIFTVTVPMLAELTIVSTVAVLIGTNMPALFRLKRKFLVLKFDEVINITFGFFILLVILIMATAPSIPLIESFRGASEEDLRAYREAFLKGRTGWEASLGYLVEIINAGLLPYLIAYSFMIKHRHRKKYGVIFFLYCISFLAKSYFFKLAIPLFFVYLSQTKNKKIFVVQGLAILVVLIFMMYVFAGTEGYQSNDELFFSTLYAPTSISEAIIWRAFVIPVMTAIDSLSVFIVDLRSHLLWGDTSSLIAFFKGAERINFERLVYQSQFGGSETGNSNSYYLIEAYVNFGWFGVVFFSFIVGKIMRLFIRKNDVALMAILPLFLLNLFSAGLISLLFSGGYLLLIILVIFVKFKHSSISQNT